MKALIKKLAVATISFLSTTIGTNAQSWTAGVKTGAIFMRQYPFSDIFSTSFGLNKKEPTFGAFFTKNLKKKWCLEMNVATFGNRNDYYLSALYNTVPPTHQFRYRTTSVFFQIGTTAKYKYFSGKDYSLYAIAGLGLDFTRIKAATEVSDVDGNVLERYSNVVTNKAVPLRAIVGNGADLHWRKLVLGAELSFQPYVSVIGGYARIQPVGHSNFNYNLQFQTSVGYRF